MRASHCERVGVTEAEQGYSVAGVKGRDDGDGCLGLHGRSGEGHGLVESANSLVVKAVGRSDGRGQMSR